MSTSLRILVGLAIAFAAVLVGATALMASVFVIGGTASVSVESSDGPDFFLPFPAALLDFAAVAADGALSAAGEDFPVELEPPFDTQPPGPVLVELLRTLEDGPDATFVEVEDGADRVRIFKEGRYLRVEVRDGRDLDLRVSVPLGTATRTLARFLD